MSLRIRVECVRGVLLGGIWHIVDPMPDAKASSFDLDSYEYIETTIDDPFDKPPGYRVLHGGGQNGVCATGFRFISGGMWHCGPLTAIQAVRYRA